MNNFKVINIEQLPPIKISNGVAFEFYRAEVECPKHGRQVFTSKKGVGLGCPACEAEKEEREERLARFRGSLQRGVARLSTALKGVPTNDGTGYTFDGFDLSTGDANQSKALDICKKFAGNFLRRHGERFLSLQGDTTADKWRNATNLLLSGKCGTGKTHLGHAIVNELKKKEVDAVFLRFPTLSGMFFDRERNQTELSDVLGSVSCLVLDEVGAFQHSDYDLKRLFEIIDLRHERALPTVFISNLNAEDLARAIGRRSADRIGARLVVLPFTWGSYRKATAQAHNLGEF